MTGKKISALTELAAEPAAADEFVVVDKSDTTQAVTGTSKRMRYDRIFSSAWTAWTPTWTNLTVGNATVDAKYVQRGKLVAVKLLFTFGSTSSISGTVSFSAPVTPVAGPQGGMPAGLVTIRDTSANKNYRGAFNVTSVSDLGLRVDQTDGTYSFSTALSSTIPMTWATGDTIALEGTYEAS